jgi:hypothetical protein
MKLQSEEKPNELDLIPSQEDAWKFKKRREVSKCVNTGHTQKNVADFTVFTIKTAPFFCVCPVLIRDLWFSQQSILLCP